MRPSWRASTGGAPPPEQLTAYLDGQLDPALCREVECWLQRHPDAALEIEEQHRLTRLWRATRPAEPEAATWATVSARIAACLTQRMRQNRDEADLRGSGRRSFVPAARIRVRRRSRLLGLVAAGGVAAGLLLVLLPPVQVPRGETAVESVLPVAAGPTVSQTLEVVAPDEVEIVSLRADDRSTLVVGEPPITEPLTLAAPGDVAVERMEPAADGMVPDIYMEEGSVAALIVAPHRAAAGPTSRDR